jgi:hypothetical protein
MVSKAIDKSKTKIDKLSSKAIEIIDSSKDLLLAEFQASTSQRQHMDDRMDKEVQYYFTLFGAASTVVGLLFQFGTTPYITLVVAHLLAGAMGVAGLRLLRRIIHLTGMGALFDAQLGLIRRSFVDADKTISPYLMLNTAAQGQTAHHYTPISEQLAVKLLSIMNSFLIGLVVFLIPFHAYYHFQYIYTQAIWIRLFIGFSGIALFIVILFFWYQRRISINRGDKYLDQITNTVHQKLLQQNNNK